ncbi:magnesium/cobalt transporter CorA [Ameyamaea chiangmaiensis NBRC 103196]|uniref:Magnesium transporter n=1 Tax=Ameyamaea chiangmaiensis TaxID=442969 RepID=A0A850PJ37_9PROT|nr:CorA family divalent cation transporter [Ameyamaea chiangmaiensis]MBS4075003.1 magnesium transporter [Ameyamaea chiangmaiensis]NVN41291.1 magnesium transporter [Ameyamaea chiangmaiensis]GBQ65822.1 magnesium/cobalt transporter CorA [Ameyamaea chiangmaiensis NBRC 103196]
MTPPLPGKEIATERRASDGLVWAVRYEPTAGTIVPLSPREVDARVSRAFDEAVAVDDEADDAPQSWIWLHYDTVHSAARARVDALPCLPDDVRTMLAGTEYGTHIEAMPGLVWGVLPAFDETGPDDDVSVCAWRFALTPDLLITTRRHPVPALGVVYRQLERGQEATRRPVMIVERTLREFTDSVRRQITVLDDQLDRAEDVLLLIDNSSDLGHISGIVGKVRRQLTELRRVMAPLNRLFRGEDLELPEWAEDELRDRAERQTHAALDDLIALQERARSLQDELASSQAEETNRRLYIVSVATTLMLPATFVTGFFGMNTGGMFLSQGRFGTVEAGIVCFLFMGITYLLLKFARLL